MDARMAVHLLAVLAAVSAHKQHPAVTASDSALSRRPPPNSEDALEDSTEPSKCTVNYLPHSTELSLLFQNDIPEKNY